MHPLYWVLAAHFVGDYVLQTEYVAREKCKSWYVMMIHCFLYSMIVTIAFMMTGLIAQQKGYVLSIEQVLWILYFSHGLLDSLKCQVFPKKYATLIDQTGHFIVLVILIGWMTIK